MKKNNRQHNEQTAYDLLIEHIEKTKSELDCAYSKFENATDPDLIDSSIYQCCNPSRCVTNFC